MIIGSVKSRHVRGEPFVWRVFSCCLQRTWLGYSFNKPSQKWDVHKNIYNPRSPHSSIQHLGHPVFLRFLLLKIHFFDLTGVKWTALDFVTTFQKCLWPFYDSSPYRHQKLESHNIHHCHCRPFQHFAVELLCSGEPHKGFPSVFGHSSLGCTGHARS